MKINSLSLLEKTVQFISEKIRMLVGLVEREVTRENSEWTAAMVSVKVRIKPSRHQQTEIERDCMTVVQQLVYSIPQSNKMRDSFKEQEIGNQKKVVNF